MSKAIRKLNDWDVLLGRGSNVNKKPGNTKFREHVKSLREEYADAERQDKTLIARRVVQRVLSHGGRFLKKKDENSDDEIFVEVNVQRAVEKSCQALREGLADLLKRREESKSAGKSKKKGGKSGGASLVKQGSKKNVSTGVKKNVSTGVKSGRSTSLVKQAIKRKVSTGFKSGDSLSKKEKKPVKRPSLAASSSAGDSFSKKKAKKSVKRPSFVASSSVPVTGKRPSSVASSAAVSRKKPRKTLSRQSSMASAGGTKSRSVAQNENQRKIVANGAQTKKDDTDHAGKDAGQYKDAKLPPCRVERRLIAADESSGSETLSGSDDDDHYGSEDDFEMNTASIVDKHRPYLPLRKTSPALQQPASKPYQAYDATGQAQSQPTHRHAMEQPASQSYQTYDATGQAQAPPTHRLMMHHPTTRPTQAYDATGQAQVPPVHRLMMQNPATGPSQTSEGTPAQAPPIHRLMMQHPPSGPSQTSEATPGQAPPTHRLMMQNPEGPPTHRLMTQNQLPTHRLMMQNPSTASITTSRPRPSTASGWFCDFMDGGSSSGSSTSYWEELFMALVHFKEIHGHCAVPPTSGSPHAWSSKEEKNHARLADWASVQRQVFRQIQNGRRPASDEEKSRLNRLKTLGFVFDYDDWLWQRRYNELVKFQEEASEGDGEDISSLLSLAVWVKEQRRLYLEGRQGKIQAMREDRVKKLEKINFSWAIGSQLPKKANVSKTVPHKDKDVPGNGGADSHSKGGPVKLVATSKDSTVPSNKVASEKSTNSCTTPKNDATKTNYNAAPEESTTPKNISAAAAKSGGTVDLHTKVPVVANRTVPVAVTPAPGLTVNPSASKDLTPATSKNDSNSTTEGPSDDTNSASAHRAMVSPELVAATKGPSTGSMKSDVEKCLVPESIHKSNGSEDTHAAAPPASTTSLQTSRETGEPKNWDTSSSKKDEAGIGINVQPQEEPTVDRMEIESNIRPTNSMEDMAVV